jgi:hypothetical protein
MGEKRKIHKFFPGKLEGKKPLSRLKHRWKHNIKMNLKEIVCEDVDWTHVAQDRVQWQTLVNMVVNLCIL